MIHEPGASDPDGKDAPQRHDLAVQRKVGRREAQRAAKLLAHPDAPGHPVGAPEQARRAIEVAAVQRLAHQRAADSLAVEQELAHLLDREPVLQPGCPQRLDRAFAAPREMKIVPDHDVTRAEASHQQAIDELAGAHAAHLRVEAQHDHAIHAVERQRFEFLAQPRQAGRRGGTLEELPRRRLERDDHRRHAQLGRLGAHGRDHVLVPAMHAVVIADGHDAATVPLAKVVYAADQLHRHGGPAGRTRNSCTRMPSRYIVPK